MTRLEHAFATEQVFLFCPDHAINIRQSSRRQVDLNQFIINKRDKIFACCKGANLRDVQLLLNLVRDDGSTM